MKSRRSPLIVELVGPPGFGKSTLVGQLAKGRSQELNWLMVRGNAFSSVGMAQLSGLQRSWRQVLAGIYMMRMRTSQRTSANLAARCALLDRVRRANYSVALFEEGVIQQLSNMIARGVTVPTRGVSVPDVCVLLRCSPELVVQRRAGTPYGQMNESEYLRFATQHQLAAEAILRQFSVSFVEVDTQQLESESTADLVHQVLRIR